MDELEKIVLEEEKLEHVDSGMYSFVLWSPGYALVLLVTGLINYFINIIIS